MQQTRYQLMKNLCIFLLILLSAGTVRANGFRNTADTGKQVLLAEVPKKTEINYFIRESNVIFPEILKNEKDASIDYIESFSTKRRDYLIRTYNRGRKVFPKAVKILKKYSLPEELKILLALESGFNADALSGAGAVGYWQIMDCVAKEYGLKYVPQLSPEEKKKLIRSNPRAADSLFKAMAKQKDDRKNFIKSTNAAARYLRDRYRNLGNNWLLVVASYNCGIGNVWDAMQRSGKANPTFWDVKNYLPAETRAYVMNFITLNVIFSNYETFAKNKLKFESEKIIVEDFDQNTNCETE